MDDNDLLHLWQKTIAGSTSGIAGMPVDVTYRPPEQPRDSLPPGLPGSASRAGDAGATIAGPRPSVDGAPAPPPDDVPLGARATLATTGGGGAPRALEGAAFSSGAAVSDSGVDLAARTIATAAGDATAGEATTRDSLPLVGEQPANRAPARDADAGATLPPLAPGGIPRAAAAAASARSGHVDAPRASTSYALTGELARGGMGVVFRARQESLAREVAVKRIIPGKSGPLERQQFLAEALVTGVLDHPNIVPVHDLGRTADGELFLAMKLVHGTSWRELLHPRTEAEKEKAGKLDQVGHIRLLILVMNAVAFAHSKGIVHRDLKPENVMVGDFGEVLLMDWGIAVDVRDGPREETARAPHRSTVSAPAGTPCYMPPELATGRGREIGPATDVYLLGAILHEVVTGAPPHEGASLLDVLRAAVASAPKRYDASVPAALQAILRRAMAKEPRDRYASVAEMKEALEHYLANRQSVKISDAAEATLARCLVAVAAPARAPAPGEGPAAGGEAPLDRNHLYRAFAETVAGFQQALLLWSENEAAVAGVKRARVAFARAALEAEDLGLAGAQAAALPEGDADGAAIRAAVAGVEAGRGRAARNARRARRLLQAAVLAIVAGLATGFLLMRGEERRVAAERDRAKVAETEAAHERDQAQVEAWNGRLEMASASYERALGLVAQETFQSAEACLLRALEIAPRGGAPPLFAPAWDAPGWPAEAWRLHRAIAPLCARESGRLGGPVENFAAAVVGPTGKVALLGCADGDVHVYDLATGAPLREVASTARSRVVGMSLAPDRRTSAIVHEDGTLRLVDVDSGAELRTLAGAEGGFLCAAVGPASRHVLAGGADRTLWLFDVATGRAAWHVDTGDGAPGRTPASVALSADGARALVGLWDGSARLFDAATGAALRTFEGAADWVSAVAFDPDGKAAWLGSNDGLLRRVDLASGKETRRVQTDDVREIAISADARTALVRLTGGGIEVHALDRGEKSGEIEPGAAMPTVVAPSADGATALVAFEREPPRLYDLSGALQRPRELATRGAPADAVAAVALSGDARLAAGGTMGGAVRVFDVATGRELGRIDGRRGRVTDVAVSADGALALAGGYDGVARVLDLEARREVRALDAGAGPVASVALRGDGRVALVACERAIVLFDVATGREVARIAAPPRGLRCARLAPDGRTIAAAGEGAVLLYDAATGRELLPLEGDPGAVSGLDFAPDASIVAAACADRAIRVWDVATGRALRRIPAHEDAVADLAFLADGRTVLSGSADRTLRLVDIASGKVLRVMRGHAAAIADVAASRDGALALSTSLDGSVLLWPLLDARAPLEPPSDLAPLYGVVGLRVAVEGANKGAIVPVGR